MLIGVGFDTHGAIDGVLREAAAELARQGLRVAGFIQTRLEATGDSACREMLLVDLASGKSHVISERRGREARGCHLDWDALLSLGERLAGDLDTGRDVLVVNRFGRSESEGKGLRSVIEKAMILGIPVVVGVRGEYAAAWEAFHGGLAQDCAAEAGAIAKRVLAAVGEPAVFPAG